MSHAVLNAATVPAAPGAAVLIICAVVLIVLWMACWRTLQVVVYGVWVWVRS